MNNTDYIALPEYRPSIDPVLDIETLILTSSSFYAYIYIYIYIQSASRAAASPLFALLRTERARKEGLREAKKVTSLAVVEGLKPRGGLRCPHAYI